MLLFIHYKI